MLTVAGAVAAAYWFKRQAELPKQKLPEPWPEVSSRQHVVPCLHEWHVFVPSTAVPRFLLPPHWQSFGEGQHVADTAKHPCHTGANRQQLQNHLS